MNKSLIAFFVLFTIVSFGQSNNLTELKGQVSAYVSNLEGIYVINLQSEQSVLTNENGDFSIKANVGDVLVFSGMQFKRKEVLLCAEDFENKSFKVNLAATVNHLNEVVIRNYNNINAVSLGIIPSNQNLILPPREN